VILSGVFGFMFAGGGALQGVRTGNGSLFLMIALPILSFLLGLAMIGGAVFYGLWVNKKQHEGPQQTVPNTRVVARYAYSREGNMLTEDWAIEIAENPRFYVRLEVPGRETAEYECAEQTFYSAPEGMFGVAKLQGKWLGQFTPTFGQGRES
jgi:hypothetical protein